MFNTNCATDRKGYLRIDCPDQNQIPPHHHRHQYSQVSIDCSVREHIESEGKCSALCDNKRKYSSEDSDKEPLLKHKMSRRMTSDKALATNDNTDNTFVKPKDTKSPMLKAGTYPIVSTHIELFRSNKSHSSKLTQVSCLVSGLDSGSASFFRAIKPWGLENYLDNYKLGGDLLKALHMTREEDGKFLYRSQFETVEEDDKIVCFEEHR